MSLRPNIEEVEEVHRIEDLGSRIEVTISGLLDEQRALDACHEAVLLSRKRGVRRFLFDVTGTAMEQIVVTDSMTMTSFRVHTAMATIFPPGSQVAFVFDPNDRPADSVSFAENVSQNRGLDLRFFPSQKQARDWLGGNGGSPVGP